MSRMATFYHFAYASNMSPYKVGIRCPSSKKYGLGKLSNHTVTFKGYFEGWKGPTATLDEENSSVVWGVIWSIDEAEKHALDELEGVFAGYNRVVTVDVLDENDKQVPCRVYQRLGEKQPIDKPSPQYLEIIVDGARLHRLPADCIADLEKHALWTGPMAAFNYFGYASNLTTYKVGLRCKTCSKYSLGKLAGYKIVFKGYSDDWKGGTATMESDASCSLWGVIWTIDNTEMQLLDDQEGVSTGDYRADTFEVEDSTGRLVKCRVYQQTDETLPQTAPSPQYLRVIVDGAKTNQLPAAYVEMLEKVVPNGNTEMTDLMRALNAKRHDLRSME